MRTCQNTKSVKLYTQLTGTKQMSDLGHERFDAFDIPGFDLAEVDPAGDMPDMDIVPGSIEAVTDQPLAEPVIVASETRRGRTGSNDVFAGKALADLGASEREAILLMERAAAYGVSMTQAQALRAGRIMTGEVVIDQGPSHRYLRGLKAESLDDVTEFDGE